MPEDHYEYKVYDEGLEMCMEWGFPTAEAARKDFVRRFKKDLRVRCVIRNSCGYVIVAVKPERSKYFRHYPDMGWHVNV